LPTTAPNLPAAHDRLESLGARVLGDAELLTLLLGPATGSSRAARAAAALLESAPLEELAWATPDQLAAVPGVGPARAAAVTAAFELGRRAGWAPPHRGDRVLDPARVHELLRHLAHAPQEEFWIVLLDVRGRLIRTCRVAEGSLAQCPVNPRDVLREAVRSNAHGVVFVHCHPSGLSSPSPDDADLTERLRAAAELVGVTARDHVIIAADGYYSFVESGRWRR